MEAIVAYWGIILIVLAVFAFLTAAFNALADDSNDPEYVDDELLERQ